MRSGNITMPNAITNLMDKNIEDSEELGNILMKSIEEHLDMKRWGFHVSHKSFKHPTDLRVIYDSLSCRVSFFFSRERFSTHDEFWITYGRLHAPNSGQYMEWQGEQCHCWHHIDEPLFFLDGLSPSNIMDRVKMTEHHPTVIDEFKESAMGKTLLEQYYPYYLLVQHSVIWQQYGQRLFDLFDFRRPDQWQQYQQFLKELYNTAGRKPRYSPPKDKVC
jgi:hypothetical protein